MLLHTSIGDFGQLLGWFFDLMKTKFNVYGFFISFWDVAVFVIVTGLIGWLIGTVFFGGGDD